MAFEEMELDSGHHGLSEAGKLDRLFLEHLQDLILKCTSSLALSALLIYNHVPYA